MKSIKWNMNIDWRSKIVDLIIVIFGITIAFKLNNWNETRKADLEVENYLRNFAEEAEMNETDLRNVLDYSLHVAREIDTLKQILLARDYANPRIKTLSASMMSLSDFNPSTTTMENITASGEFGMIKDNELKKRIIDTYNSYHRTTKLQEMLFNYVDKYLTPYLFNNVLLGNFSPIALDFTKDPLFENIIVGYEVLLNQLIDRYQDSLKKIELLKEALGPENVQK